ncbi:MAG: Asp-tRNA(Asn)/Glu-tRNA(Gln) amidotransferase subunit GatC [Saprospiraceae bacterium]|nr:Asp-tRNA(Asn)/Glu-tRNA(Gln) amidotransferase subunit GatC [Saprospiraceae bacterium]
MAIEDNVILKLEKLAKLRLTNEERGAISKDLEKILTMVDKLEEIDTEGVEPLLYIHEEVNVLRKDSAENKLSTEEGLSNAPKRIKDYFAVPKIINK